MTWLLAGCDGSGVRTIRVTAHTLSECPIPLEAARGAELVLEPLGDFADVDPSRAPLGGVTAETLDFPEGTRALTARVDVEGQPFIGYSERGAGTDVPVLLWPEKRACRLSTGDYPADGGGQGLGYDASSRRVLLAGGYDPTQLGKSVEMLGFDAGTGAVTAGLALDEPREFATVTPFGGELLLAGGEDPWNSQDMVVASSREATVIDASAATPVVKAIALRVPRTRHGATVLPNGDTLLVGGRGPFGDALNLLEAISPNRDQADVAGYPALRAPRLFPAVLPLDDGRLLVGGGTAADASPLSALEWLSLDARTRLGLEVPEELPARHDRAFVAMPGGGALIVGGCAPRAPEPGEDCSMCGSGCPPRFDASAPEYDAWWLLPDDRLERLDFAIEAPRPVLLGELGRALLSPGTPGSALYRFDPWRAEFVAADDVLVPCAPRAGLPAIRLDPEAFVWVSDAGDCAARPALMGMRTGLQNRYASDAALDLVPDRPPVGSAGERARYDGRELWFAAGSDVRVYVAGRDYGDFTLSFELGEGSVTPRLVFTSDERAGAVVVAVPAAASRSVRAVRSGTKLFIGSSAFEVPAGRLRVGLAGGDAETLLTALRLER